MLVRWLKTLIVNSISIDSFVWLAKYLPIGGWLEYEELDWMRETSVYQSIRDRNKERLKRILNVASDEAVHRYLVSRNVIGISPIEFELCISKAEGKDNYLKVLLKAVKPENRYRLLQAYRLEPRNFFIGLMLTTAKLIDTVLSLLPEGERFLAIDTKDEYGLTPLMFLVSRGTNCNMLKAVLRHCPEDQLFNHLTRVNERGETALVILSNARTKVDAAFRYILNSIPRYKRAEFLATHNQGEKIMLLAHATGKTSIKRILSSYGYRVPKLTPAEAEKRYEMKAEENVAKENFKKDHGAYPLTLLGIENENCEAGDIKRAYHRKMLLWHPDRCRDPRAPEMSRQIISAYEFYDKPETRKTSLVS